MIDFSKLEQYRENNRIEAKKALGGLPRSIWETYSAFANTLGGVILLGVVEQEDHTLRSIRLPDPEALARQFWQQLSDPRQASVNILSKHQVRVEQADGNRIVAITVPRAQRLDRPVYIDGDPLNGTYRRSGEGDYRCTREEVEAMLRDAAVRTPDMQVLESCSLAQLDGGSIQRYRARLRRLQPGSVWEQLEQGEFLYQLGAAGPGEDRRLHPTAAGLLMFGRAESILCCFPHYQLEYRELPAPPAQGGLCICSSDGGWSGNLYDFYFRVCERLTRGQPGGAAVGRALREALANCLINADYHSRQGVQILRRDNEVRLTNPGGFRIEVAAALAGGVSDPRNAALIRIFNRIRVGGGTGSGIPQIYAVWRARGWAAPRIQQEFEPERTTLWLQLGRSGSTAISDSAGQDRESGGAGLALARLHKQLIVEYLTDHRAAGLEELAGYLGLGLDSARRCLEELVAVGILTAEGAQEAPVYALKA